MPKKYWTVQTKIAIDNQCILCIAKRGRIFERKKALEIKEGLKAVKMAKVVAVKTERKSLQRPQALNTVEMLKSASTGLGMSPHHTMQIAERLYMQGYISYPRTETTKYPPNFDLNGALKDIKGNSPWAGEVDSLIKEGFSHPEGGKDVGDHPPITPMRLASEYDLSGDSWRLYDFICRYFVGSLMPNCKYLRTQVTLSVGGELFECSGRRVVVPGFTSVMHWRTIAEEGGEDEKESLPAKLETLQDQEIELTEVNLREGETTPPDYLTESDLIEQMEKLGIGTDASMAVHISNICDRRYTSVQGNRRFMVPSNLGIVVIHGYQKIDPELALPTLRSAMEKKITLIAEAKAKDTSILEEELKIYSSKFVNLTEKVRRSMYELLNSD